MRSPPTIISNIFRAVTAESQPRALHKMSKRPKKLPRLKNCGRIFKPFLQLPVCANARTRVRAYYANAKDADAFFPK